ncbi:MAG: hypothetical protein JWO60_696 [Frankiales bacterium]|nr:hypothetical protein [Frankiales bacterium]
MSRKTLTAKAVVVAGAVAATTLFAGGTANAATPVVTKVGPALAGTTVGLPMVVTGTGFSDDIKKVVWAATDGTLTCASTALVVVSSTTLYAVKPTSGCAAGLQRVELHDNTTPAASGTQLGTDFVGTSKTTVTFVTPAGVSSALAAPTTGVAGTPLTFTGLTGLVATGLSATLGGKPLASVKYVSASSFTAVAPGGINNGDAALQVTSGGVVSDLKAGIFSFKPTLTVAPAFAPKGTPGDILITGLGLKPASPATVAVTVCGVTATPVTPTTAKPYTDTKLWVTAPSAAAIQTAQGGSSAFATDGGACTVKVVVDVNGATADVAGSAAVVDDPATTSVDETAAAVPAQVNPTSVVTKTSTFTYTAY